MTTFRVTTDELVEIANRVATTSSDLREAPRVAGHYHGAAGSARIDGQLDDFFAQWSDAVHVISGDLDGVVGRLMDAAAAYAGADRAVQGAAGGGC